MSGRPRPRSGTDPDVRSEAHREAFLRRALVTGATGLLGTRLTARLAEAGTEVVVLSRRSGGAATFAWEPEAGPPPAEAFREVEAVFHLAAEPLADGRWNDEKRRRIRESRVVGTRNLVAGLERLAPSARPKVLVSASAVGFYGSRGDELLDESSAVGTDFLAEVCAAWEREAQAAQSLGVRVVCQRTGFVLSPRGGGLEKMLPFFKAGVGGRLGNGQQWMSWIHLDDAVGLMLHAASSEAVQGPLNAVAPHPVNNADFTRALAHALHRPALFPVPGLALRAVFGQMGEVVLSSQRAVPRVAERTGYRFRYSELGAALESVLSERAKQ